MFKKSFRDKKIKFGSRKILDEGLAVFRQLFFDPQRLKQIKDRYGVIGYVFGNIILTGKRETYGDVISVSRKIWDMALKEKKAIVMYLRISGYFYRFNPAKIKNTHNNFRGDTEMVNYDIREGVNLMKLKAKKEKIDLVVLKNRAKKIKEEEELKNFSKNVLV